MEHVLSGIKKFQEEVFPEQRKLFDKLACGQHPPILLDTCADSRTDPSLITQTEPGYIESAEVFCYDEEEDSRPSVFERQTALIGDEGLESG
jgi:hypothetical protein